MTKKEAIQAAYGDHWDRVKNFVDGNGWTEIDERQCGYDLYSENDEESAKGEIEYLNYDTSNHWRPIELSGLEDNNGWIPGLPPEWLDYVWVYTEDRSVCIHPNDITFLRLNVTHWQPLEKPNPPIYDSE